MQYPTLTRSSVRHIEVVTMTPRRLLLVLITSTGRVEQRIVEPPHDVDEQLIADLRSRLNTALTGQRLTDAATSLAAVTETFAAVRPAAGGGDRDDADGGLHRRGGEQRIAVGGAANLTRYGDDFERNVKPVLEALEEHVILLKLLGEATNPQTLTVRIGHENPYEELATTSVVATGYGSQVGGAGHPRHRRPDPHGLSEHDGRGPRRRALRQPDPGRLMTTRFANPWSGV